MTKRRGNDPGLVAGLHEQQDISRRLHDLVIAVVAGAVPAAKPRHSIRDAALRVVKVLDMLAARGGRGGFTAAGRGGGRRRNVAVGRIYDQRGVPVELPLDHLLRAMRRGGTLETIAGA